MKEGRDIYRLAGLDRIGLGLYLSQLKAELRLIHQPVSPGIQPGIISQLLQSKPGYCSLYSYIGVDHNSSVFLKTGKDLLQLPFSLHAAIVQSIFIGNIYRSGN
ncbi:MAG: hypothetical protein CG446_1188 [Methanosaeta sp. ASO1]|nr:MAG: hypothetical protein CG446_1188 [Methanosaeta sp. ASO1]